MSKLKLKNPLNPWIINQHFGQNLNAFYKQLKMKGHNGIDARAVDGQPVYASHDGVVTFAGEDGDGGLGVVIRTEEKFDYEGKKVYFKSLYWHLKTGSICVHASQKVKAGDKIAEADNTGRSTGTHLHFGLKPVAQGEKSWLWENVSQDNGYKGAIDPAPYMDRTLRFARDLRLGVSGEDVRELQKTLMKYGFLRKGDATTYYGPLTMSAVAKYQKQYSITPSLGFFGEKTRAHLNNLLSEQEG